MITINLNRLKKQGKAVIGTLSFPMYDRNYQPRIYKIKTLENAEFIIPDGTYPLERTWSPKFKKDLPEIQDVPERSGIRIHRGAIPEHSKGCILTDLAGMSDLNVFFNQLEFEEDGSVQINITSEFAQN